MSIEDDSDTPLLTFPDLSDYERSLFKAVRHDISSRSTLTILRPKGVRKFIITPSGVMLGLIHTVHGYRHSSVKLRRGEDRCTLEVLRHVLLVVCREAGAVIESVQPYGQEPAHYVYTVRYQ